jgi:hypothetical protein
VTEIPKGLERYFQQAHDGDREEILSEFVQYVRSGLKQSGKYTYELLRGISDYLTLEGEREEGQNPVWGILGTLFEDAAANLFLLEVPDKEKQDPLPDLGENANNLPHVFYDGLAYSISSIERADRPPEDPRFGIADEFSAFVRNKESEKNQKHFLVVAQEIALLLEPEKYGFAEFFRALSKDIALDESYNNPRRAIERAFALYLIELAAKIADKNSDHIP